MTREFLLIRHAPVETDGRLIGRCDWPATLPIGTPAPAVTKLLHGCDLRLSSPALRCQQTAAWLGGAWDLREALWEQDFGAWQGQRYADLPDLGPLDRTALAAHQPPGGESFGDVCRRFAAFTQTLPQAGRIAVMAHAGIVRAALSLALETPEAGLAFEIAPLSLTRLTETNGVWAIGGVNLALASA